MHIPKTACIRGAVSGALIGLAVAAVPTALDWYANHSGLFRDANGTDWGIVGETLFSWWWPLALVVVPLGVAVCAWRTGRS